MESALYGIYGLIVFVSEILLVLPSNNQHCIEKKKNAVAIWPVTGQGVKNTK